VNDGEELAGNRFVAGSRNSYAKNGDKRSHRAQLLFHRVARVLIVDLLILPPSLLSRAHAPPLFMNEIKVEVWDATGNKRQWVEAPADAEVNRLIAVLIERMNLPRHSPDGQMMSYKFHHKSSGRQLLDSDTLLSADVKDGDILRLQPEITAGAF